MTRKTSRRRSRSALSSNRRAEATFLVARWFMEGRRPKEIVARLQETTGIVVTRERVYPLVRDAVRLGYLLFAPPRDAALGEILEAFPNRGKVTVVDVPGSESTEDVAAAGADVVFDLIQGFAARRNGGPVHLGLGIGRTTSRVCRRLSARMRSARETLSLVVHALTPAYSVRDPLENPISSFSYFNDVLDQVEFVGLFAEPVVLDKDYGKVVGNPIVKPAFNQRFDIDIVISSLATGLDTHGSLRQYVESFGTQPSSESIDWDPWVGDVQLRPYSESGPLPMTRGVKPVTLFELKDLVDIASDPDKEVVLLCGPCGGCMDSKASALIPLLTEPSLRLWTQLIVDRATAKEIIALKVKQPAPAGVRPTGTA